VDWLDRRFRLAERGSSVRTELAAGLTTFVTLSYILFVQPALLSKCGMDPGGVLFATCVASAIACFLMGWWANHPIGLAPAMGHNVFFVFVACGELGFTWQEALAANFLAGALFLVLAPLRFRERIMEAIPDPLKYAIAAGIGLLIALVGFEWGGIVVDDPEVYVRLGDLGEPVVRLTLFGLVVTAILLVRGVRGATLIGIVATGTVGWLASVLVDGVDLVRSAGLAGPIGAPPAPTAAFELDLAGLFDRPLGDWLAVVAVFFLLDLFDTIGTLVGVGDQAGLLVDGKLPRAGGALAADATGTTLGALLGTSTITANVESAAGVAAGGRTGLTAIACGACLLAALFLRPLIEAVGAGAAVELGGATVTCYPVLAPVLILIGALMLRAVRRIDWSDTSQAIPCFLTIAVMPLSFSITEGIGWGVIAWSLLSLASRRRSAPAVHVLAAVFVLRYVFL
jgi:AGZA family xanthine/uracil permease-like MFS transporter